MFLTEEKTSPPRSKPYLQPFINCLGEIERDGLI